MTQLLPLIAAAAKHLGVNQAVLTLRAERLARNLGAAGELVLEQAAARLGQLTLQQFCALLAEGPVEQTRACLTPEEVHPHAHQGLGGHGVPVPHGAPREETAEL